MIYISKLWKFIQGYVIIYVKGYNIEKLINKTVQSDIAVHNIKKTGNTALVTISPKDFKNFVKLCRKYKCKSKIVNKNGSYRTLLFFRLNFMYLAGLLLSFFIVYFLTQRVWIIDISGNSRIDKLSILTSCNENGLYVGCNKNSIDCKAVAENIKLKYKNISWINVSLKGTSIHIKLSEDKPETVNTLSDSPVNIVSSVDCRISSIVTDKGTPLVKKNDIVKEGDVLISAQLVPSGLEENPVTDIVSARGSVRGILTRNYSFTIPYTSTEKKYTGSKKTGYTIKFFNRSFTLNDPEPYKYNESSSETIQLKLGENCPLPFFIIKNINSEYILNTVKTDISTAKKAADKQIIDHIIQNYSTDSDILSVNTKYNEGKTSLQVSAEITSEENICKEIPYEDLGGNELNGTTENSNIS
ncbi:MAG: sporulation protein YqfD [Clostridia bacterium]|nr:sporulation protein YqfD [Clostridia bacterium]